MFRRAPIPPSNKPILYLFCAKPKQLQPILLCLIGLVFSIIAISKQLHRDMNISYAFCAMNLVIGAIFVAVLYRNLFWIDELYIVRGLTEVKGGDYRYLSAEEVRSVQRRPAPDPRSFQGWMLWLGLGLGPIEIETDERRLRFGVGLRESSVDDTIKTIVAFCRLPRQ